MTYTVTREARDIERALIEAIINDYHTTRLDSDYVPHILGKLRTQQAFAKFEAETLERAADVAEEQSWRIAAAIRALKGKSDE